MTKQERENTENLLREYLNGNCSGDEIRQLFKILKSPENEAQFKDILMTQLDEFDDSRFKSNPVNFGGIYERILSEIRRTGERKPGFIQVRKLSKNKRLIIEILSFAAVFFIAFYIGRINSNNSYVLNGEPSVISYNEITAPLGAKSEMILSDGTKIILNAGSTLKYTNAYNSLNRDLELEGEAYFKVAENKSLPLVVNAGKLIIKATGTEFNVKAYSEEGIIETTLIEGNVEISQKGEIRDNEILELKPNQKAIYTGESDRITLEKVRETEPQAVKPARATTENLLISPKTDIDQVTAWINNKLIIRKENFESLCVKLQRKYNVTFVFGDEEIKKYRFTGVLLDETFEQVMDAIKLVAPVDYSVEGKLVTLVSDRNGAGN